MNMRFFIELLLLILDELLIVLAFRRFVILSRLIFLLTHLVLAFSNYLVLVFIILVLAFLLMILFTQLRQTCFLVVQLLSQSGQCTSFLKCFPHPDNFLPSWKLSQSRIVTIPWICTSFAELSIVMVKLLSFRTFVTTRTRYYAVVKLMSKNGEKTLTHIIAEIYRYPADFSGIRPDTGFD